MTDESRDPDELSPEDEQDVADGLTDKLATEVNELPPTLRNYIHSLKTCCEPAVVAAELAEILGRDEQRREPMLTFELGDGLIATASFAQLSAALSRAQGKFSALEAKHTAKVSGDKGGRSYGYEYQYAKLADALAASIPALSAEALTLIQSPSLSLPRTVTVTTVLSHESGEYLKSSLTLEAENGTPQKVGAAVTYARRYSMLALIGLSPEDDDAQPDKPRTSKGRGAAPPAPRDDEIEKELVAISKAMAAAKDEDAMAKVMKRINKLPKQDRPIMHEPYLERLKEIKGETS